MNIHAMFGALAVVLAILAAVSGLGSCIAQRWDLLMSITAPSALFFCVAVGMAQ